MSDHTDLRDRIRRAVYERLAHGPSAPDVLDPIADAAMSVIAPVLDRERALKDEMADTDRIAIDYLRGEVERLTHTLTNARAVSDDRIADREAALRDIMRERDEARAELERLRAAATEVRR